jgi:hypothetical protein
MDFFMTDPFPFFSKSMTEGCATARHQKRAEKRGEKMARLQETAKRLDAALVENNGIQQAT